MAMKWFLRACPACGGDLHDDIEDKGWVTCFMCARSFNGRDVPAVQAALASDAAARAAVARPALVDEVEERKAA